MGVLTPYATGAAPIYFGSGYIKRKEFWSLGSIFGLIFLIALLGLGIPYLRALHPH
jgi:L-tartrate/succinate antiporter